MSKVSVIIPVYNVEKYVEECLQSVVNQTYSNLEIIIIDDGSTDNSGKICDGYAQKDNRIQVIHTANQGAANAKNEGLNRITGEYFCFVDSDDYYAPNFVEKMLTTMKDNNCEIVQCQFANVFVDKSVPFSECTNIRTFDNYEFMLDFANRWIDALFANKMFRFSLLKDIRFIQHRYIDDEFFTYKLVLNANKILEIPDVLYNYRMRKSSVTKTPEAQKKILLDQADFASDRYAYVKEYYPDLKQALLEYMITVFIQIRNNKYVDKNILKYVNKKIRMYFLDIFFGKCNIRNKLVLVKSYFTPKKNNIETKDIAVDNFNYYM